jgi:hypothetical protein
MDSRTRKSSSTATTTTICFASFVISKPISDYAWMVSETRLADNHRFIQTGLDMRAAPSLSAILTSSAGDFASILRII